MREQEHTGINPSAQETSPLHEQGELTPEYWREIHDKLTNEKIRIDPVFYPRFSPRVICKVISYAEKVITGEFPSDTEHDREYLGRGHWEMVENIPTLEMHEKPGRIPLLGRLFPDTVFINVDNDTLREVRDYATREKLIAHPTLEDFLDSDPTNFGALNDRLEFHKNRGWSGFEYVEVDFDMAAGTSYTKASLSVAEVGELLRESWYLSEEEAPNILSNSPEELRQIARDLADKDPENITRWGWKLKPIPQAALGR